MKTMKVPAEPLQKIAVSCSGGGYRAASYHLGTLAYLHHLQYLGKPLLENVKMISTVSGGTITGAVYALKKQQGEDFESIYLFLVNNIASLDLIKMGLVQLNPDAQWPNTHKRKNLINAFAQLYDTHFTGGETFAAFETMHSHLEAVVFNSTEFKSGRNFRFRNKTRNVFGNREMPVRWELAQEVKIADAIASSSCFPGGFEPLLWPHDYCHENAPQLIQVKATHPGTGIMDGGIYDNQGIESILQYKEKGADPYFDLVVISDVASPYMDPWQPMKDPEKKGWMQLTLEGLQAKAKKYLRLATFGLIAGILIPLLLPLLWQYAPGWATTISLATGLAFGLIAIALMVVSAKAAGALKKLWSGNADILPAFYKDKLGHLHIEKLSARRIMPLLADRVTSVITLLSDVFLKVVRRLNYYKLYDDDRYEFRRITTLIKELTAADYQKKYSGKVLKVSPVAPDHPLSGPYQTVVSKAISEVAEEAGNFGTTLWFTEDEVLKNMLAKLIACGNMTMCYNLIDYLYYLIYTPDNGYADLPLATRNELENLYAACCNDWKHFNENPFWLTQKMNTPL